MQPLTRDEALLAAARCREWPEWHAYLEPPEIVLAQRRCCTSEKAVRLISNVVGSYLNDFDRDPLSVAVRLEEYAAGLEESDA